VHPKGAKSKAMSGLSFGNSLVGTGWAISVVLGGGVGCTWRVQTAWPCLDPALETSWLALDGPILLFYA